MREFKINPVQPEGCGAAVKGVYPMADYMFPSINELSESTETSKYQRQEVVTQQAEKLLQKFAALGMEVKMLDCHFNSFALLIKLRLGETVTQKMVRDCWKDIELEMEDPVEFKDDEQNEKIIWIAIKDEMRPVIALKDILRSREFQDSTSGLAFGAGVDLFGGKLIIDLKDIRNLLVIGVTGSGKSVFLSNIILSILFRARPEEVQFIFFDFKGVDLPLFNDIPHQIRPSVKDAGTALEELRRLEKQAKKRLEALEKAKAGDIDAFNEISGEKMAHVVLIIDEYMSLVQGRKQSGEMTGKEFVRIIQFLASTTAQTGIHLVLATQRPSANVVTKEISEAIPHRISFYVMTGVDSKIAINRTGAQRLLGAGDMIYADIRSEKGTHAQAAYVTDSDIDKVIRFCRDQWEYTPEYPSFD